MAASYVQPTQKQFDDLLLPLGFKLMTLPRTVELVYGKRADVGEMPLSIRVYSSVNPDGQGREVGTDAIRVNLWTKYSDQPMKVGGEKRVNRTANWQDRLLERIKRLTPGPRCPKCDAPMVLRSGKHGEFWGCIAFRVTACKGSRQVEK